MLIKHHGKTPQVHRSARVAPNATLCGDVTIGPHTQVLFGAVISAEGDAVEIGENCVVMENAVLRGTPGRALKLGNHVLVGPHAHLTGCIVEDNAFLATGCSVFTGARIGKDAEIRVNGIVHLKTVLPAHATVPLGWIAVGDPCRILPPEKHEDIWAIQKPLDFPKTVFGLDRPPAGETIMPTAMSRYAQSLGRHHRDDQILKDE